MQSKKQVNPLVRLFFCYTNIYIHQLIIQSYRSLYLTVLAAQE